MPGAGTYTFTYQTQNSQGTVSAGSTVTLIFPAGRVLRLSWWTVQDKTATIRTIAGSSRRTARSTSTPIAPRTPACGLPDFGSGVVPTLGTNFHTSYMPFVAQGCTGPLSCEVDRRVWVSPRFATSATACAGLIPTGTA